MSNIKNLFDGISERKKNILTKLAGEFVDGVTFDPSFSDEEVDYILLAIQDEINKWFTDGRNGLCGEED